MRKDNDDNIQVSPLKIKNFGIKLSNRDIIHPGFFLKLLNLSTCDAFIIFPWYDLILSLAYALPRMIEK